MVDVIRVLVVDDDALVRVGLSMVLGADRGIEVVGEVADGAQAVAEAGRLRPDVVLMDIRMPGMDGLTATEALRSGSDGPAVLVLTTFDTDDYVLRALRAGANGFVLKDTPPRQILESVRRVAAGEFMLSQTVLARLIDQVVQGEGRPGGEGPADPSTEGGRRQQRAAQARAALDQLTEREREVALAISAGKSNAEIGAELYVSIATVKADVSRILAKLGCTNRVQVAILIYEAGA